MDDAQINRFAGMFRDVNSDLLQKLDLNFQALNAPLVVTKTSTSGFTFKSTDSNLSLQANATTVALTIYLPSSPTGNRRRTVTKIDATVNQVTVNGNGALINGASTYALAAQYASVTVEPTGTGWLVVASYP